MGEKIQQETQVLTQLFQIIPERNMREFGFNKLRLTVFLPHIHTQLKSEIINAYDSKLLLNDVSSWSQTESQHHIYCGYNTFTCTFAGTNYAPQVNDPGSRRHHY